MEKIDFVLPWVDGGDKEWQKRKAKYNPLQDSDTNANARFRDMETLKYALRAIEKNCPWYNKIYLITEGHYPDWLDTDNDKIVLVTHDELYFDKSHLPVFSSSSIEMNLPNIKGISEKFIYLNDDMVIMKSIEPERFFRDGKPVDFFSHGWIPRNKLFEKLRGMDTWVYSLNNNLQLINKHLAPFVLSDEQIYHYSYPLKTKLSNYLFDKFYKNIFWLEHWHHPQPYLKSTLDEVYNACKEEMMRCSINRFRANNDLTQYLYRYWQLAKEEFYPYYHNDALIANLGSIDILNSLIEKLESRDDINFVCFNDDTSLSDNDYNEVKNSLVQYLEMKFPKKATFEKEDKCNFQS